MRHSNEVVSGGVAGAVKTLLTDAPPENVAAPSGGALNIEAALEVGGSRGSECGERGVATDCCVTTDNELSVVVSPVTVRPLLTDAPPESVAAPLSVLAP